MWKVKNVFDYFPCVCKGNWEKRIKYDSSDRVSIFFMKFSWIFVLSFGCMAIEKWPFFLVQFWNRTKWSEILATIRKYYPTKIVSTAAKVSVKDAQSFLRFYSFNIFEIFLRDWMLFDATCRLIDSVLLAGEIALDFPCAHHSIDLARLDLKQIRWIFLSSRSAEDAWESQLAKNWKIKSFIWAENVAPAQSVNRFERRLLEHTLPPKAILLLAFSTYFFFSQQNGAEWKKVMSLCVCVDPIVFISQHRISNLSHVRRVRNV